ncbi:hypothetical protein TNCV_4690011 [Trichonephila clavipes]|nr:hypothetical protein TNCV_4690011 [Trichonephila clavipes]
MTRSVLWTRPWSLKGVFSSEIGIKMEIGFELKGDFTGVRGKKRGSTVVALSNLTSGTTEKYGEASIRQCKDVWEDEIQSLKITDHTGLAQRGISLLHY